MSQDCEVYLRDKLANFHLDDGVLQLDLKELGLHRNSLGGLVGMR